jgi:hypothetical protein
MQTTNPNPHEAIGSILIPMNSVESGGAALAHALRIAVASKSCLRVLHLDQSPLEAAQSPLIESFRRMQEHWGMQSVMGADTGTAIESVRVDSMQIDSVQSSDANSLQFKVLEFSKNSHDQVPSCLDEYRKHHSTDMIVLDAEAQDGWMGHLLKLNQFANSRSTIPATLFVPNKASCFVSPSSGVIRLTKILIPCISDPHPINALILVSRLVECLEQRRGSFTLLYVGSPDTTPNINPPRVDGWTWVIKTMPGSPAEKILQQAECMEADLIVLTIVRMDGSDSTSDSSCPDSSCLGPIPLEVVRRSRCPTLLVPMEYG